jgi:hypothetical protein
MTKRPGKKRAKTAEKSTRKSGARKKSGTAKPRALVKAAADKPRRQKPIESRPVNSSEWADLFADHLIGSALTYASLQDRLTGFLLDDFSGAVNDPQLNDPVPSELSSAPGNLNQACRRLRAAFEKDASWGVDSAKFKLGGSNLVDAIARYNQDHEKEHRKATIGWLISLIYHYVLAARVGKVT